jgi:hypothetical protein
MGSERYDRAAPRSPGTVGRFGLKTYNGLVGWQRRLAWFQEDPTRPEPHQWRTARGERRCVRCGVREDAHDVAIESNGWFCCEACEEIVLEELTSPCPVNEVWLQSAPGE